MPERFEETDSEFWTERALQTLYLKRQWEILEVFKSLRTKVPVVFCGTILAFSSFMMEGERHKTDSNADWSIPAIIGVLVLLGNVVLWWIARQYKYTDRKIEHLYGELGMKGSAFRKEGNTSRRLWHKMESAPLMFLAGHFAILCIGGIFALGFYL